MTSEVFRARRVRPLAWFCLALLFILPALSEAQIPPGRRVQSVLFYTLVENGGPKFLSLGEAVEAAKSVYAGDPDVYFTDVTPYPGVGTINGVAGRLQANMMYRHGSNNPYVQGSVLIYVGYECARGMTGVPLTVPGGQVFQCELPQQKQASSDPKGPACQQCKKSQPYHDSGSVGDPIQTSIGAAEAFEEDFVDDSVSSLTFSRWYRSDLGVWRNNFSAGLSDLIHPEKTEVKQTILGVGTVTGLPMPFPVAPLSQDYDMVYVGRYGNAVSYGGNVGFADKPKNVNDGIRIVWNDEVMNGYEVTNAYSGDKELFNAHGRLVKVTTRNGLEQRFYYSDLATPRTIADQPGLLIRVTDHFGRQITFTHVFIPNVGSRLASMTDPMNRTTLYKYDEATSIVLPGSKPVGNLTSVTHPDGTVRRYWYNEQALTGNTNQQFALTGVTDERGVRLTTYKYNADRKAVSTEAAGGVQKFTVTYYGDTSYVTDPLGALLTYRFSSVLGTMKMTQLTVPSPTGSTVPRFVSYDANGNLASRSDYMGTQTKYTYDLVSNLETSRVDAFGTPLARTTTTEWDTTLRVPTKVAEPGRLTTLTYDTKRNVLTEKVQATNDPTGALGLNAVASGPARTTTYEYNSLGQRTKVTGPRTDVADVTLYAYDPATGNLISVTNAAGLVTTLSNYDARGKVGTIRAPDGVTTHLSYTDHGELATQTVTDGSKSRLTSYTYNEVNKLTHVVLPDQSSITYSYDDAQRLTDITDSLGNTVHYVLDNNDNRIGETTRDPNGILVRQITRVFDTMSRLKTITGGQQ